MSLLQSFAQFFTELYWTEAFIGIIFWITGQWIGQTLATYISLEHPQLLDLIS